MDEEFFRRVRALCYVISGQDQRREEGMRAVLDALLASKQQWDRDLQVRASRDPQSILVTVTTINLCGANRAPLPVPGGQPGSQGPRCVPEVTGGEGK